MRTPTTSPTPTPAPVETSVAVAAEPAGGRQALNPAAMSVENAALVLSRLGGRPVNAEMLRADLEAGAPTNADGTINLVHYGAWLVREMARRGG